MYNNNSMLTYCLYIYCLYTLGMYVQGDVYTPYLAIKEKSQAVNLTTLPISSPQVPSFSYYNASLPPLTGHLS